MCLCTTAHRCVEAHGLRDAYQQARDPACRIALAAQYTRHLRQATLLGPTATATPAWACDLACAPTAPCRTQGSPPRKEER